VRAAALALSGPISVSDTQQQAFLTSLFVMMPAVLLSGIMTPIESMPAWLQPVTYLNPLRYDAEIVRAVVVRGATLSDVATPLAALAACGLLLASIATRRFRKTVG
jgi:ABC-2 type transport system permease protein